MTSCDFAARGRKKSKNSVDKWNNLIELSKAQKWDELERLYPGDWIRQGAKLKSLYWTQKPTEKPSHVEHLWIWGSPGTGKSNIVEVLFPGYYYKRPDEDWTGYTKQETVYIGDLDPISFQHIGYQNLKVWADPQGFNANRKYGGGEHIIINRLVVTSNFRIWECMKPGVQGYGPMLAAIQRRFREIHISQLLKENNLKLRSPIELEILKANKNHDYSKCFQPIDDNTPLYELELNQQEITDIINKLPI